MALLSTLVERIADVEGMDKAQASGIARYLREAGYISQAGRGRGAAHMTARDAAHLLIGLNASKTAKDSPEELKYYCSLTNRWNFVSNLDGICVRGNNLVDDFEKIILLCQDADFSKDLLRPKTDDVDYAVEISASFHWPIRYVMIFIKEVIHQDSVPEDADLAKGLYGGLFEDAKRNKQEPDRKEIITISHHTFLTVAEALKPPKGMR